MATTNWWAPLYDDLLATMLLEPQEEAELDMTARFLTNVLEIRPGMRLFDQCSGLGQLAVTLAAAGNEVIGVDQAAAYVERASALARERGVPARFEVGDAFERVIDPPCDGAYNWWTSYGYASTDAENGRMIERAFESLRPGARFALDVPNVPGLLRGFLPSVVTRRKTPGGIETVLVRESTIDLPRGVLCKRWTYLLPDGRRVEHPSEVRLYMPHELVATFERAGFEDVALHGSVRGEPIALDSPRCIVVGRRPR
jgi:SAM-dependent methyltransferase